MSEYKDNPELAALMVCIMLPFSALSLWGTVPIFKEIYEVLK